jgi:hypothetical protein
MTKNKIPFTLILVLFPFFISKIFEFTKIATLTTLIFIILFLIFYKSLFSHEGNLLPSYKSIKTRNQYSFIYLFLLLLLTFMTQNKYLNFETITWDIPSYLVASQEINRGFLPQETQWESKGPFFLYLYNFISNIGNNNYLYFKLLNDLVLFISTVFLYSSISNIYKNRLKAFMCSVLFVLITSHVWFISEFSEIYCLSLLSFSYFIYKRYPKNKFLYFLLGLSISFSTLINQGTVIFLIPYLLIVVIKKENNFLVKIRSILTGFLIPHIFFISYYYANDLLDIYISQYIQLPLNYVSSSDPSLSEILVISRELFQYDYFLYFSLISTLLFLIPKIFKENKKDIFSIELLNFLIAVSLFFIAGHNYQHHLFYAIFFFVVFISKLKIPSQVQFVYFLIFCSSISIGLKNFEDSYYNLTNRDLIYNNYPLKKLSLEISSLVGNSNFNILALDYVLVLYYLDIPNISYIIHPGNHTEEYIVEELIRLNRVKVNKFNHVSYLIEQEPKVILCNPTLIVNGVPEKVDFYNCGISDYKRNYKQINTQEFKNNSNLNFYVDPYKEINVFIRED